MTERNCSTMAEECRRPGAPARSWTELARIAAGLPWAAHRSSARRPAAPPHPVPRMRWWRLSASRSSVTGRTHGSSRRTSHGSQRSSRRALGGGLVELQPIVSVDPMLALMTDPSVPLAKRYCPGCDAKLNLEKGFARSAARNTRSSPASRPETSSPGSTRSRAPSRSAGSAGFTLGWDRALLALDRPEGSAQHEGCRRLLLPRRPRNAVPGRRETSQDRAASTTSSRGRRELHRDGVRRRQDAEARSARSGGRFPVTEAIAYMHGILPAFGLSRPA